MEIRLSRIRELYNEYYHSVPAPSWKYKKHKFLARTKDATECTDEELMSAPPRSVAEKNLIQYINQCLKDGSLVWQDSWGSWFYKDSEYPTLILMKEWFDKGEIV